MPTTIQILSKVNGLISAFNAQNAKAFGNYYAEDCTIQRLTGEIMTGRTALEESLTDLFAAVPDAKSEVVQIIATEQNTAVIEIIIRGTHLGALKLNPATTLPASGRSIAFPICFIDNYNDRDEIQTQREVGDTMALMEQLGAVPLPVTQAEITALAERSLESWNQHDPEAIAATFTENGVSQYPGAPAAVGREAIAEKAQEMFTAFPDFTISVSEQLVQDTRLVTILTVTGTHTGPLGPIPASGKPVEVSGVSISEVDVTGLIKSNKVIYDRTSLLQQIGAIPGQQ